MSRQASLDHRLGETPSRRRMELRDNFDAVACAAEFPRADRRGAKPAERLPHGERREEAPTPMMAAFTPANSFTFPDLIEDGIDGGVPYERLLIESGRPPLPRRRTVRQRMGLALELLVGRKLSRRFGVKGGVTHAFGAHLDSAGYTHAVALGVIGF